MREFKTMTKDTETGMQMVLSECSYNMAMDYIMRKGFTYYDYFEPSGRFTTLEFSRPTKRTFVYDEERGYLLAD